MYSLRSHTKNGYIAYEDTIPSDHEVLVLGYQQSKWVSERIMALAKERGIPVSIYRVGRISGSSTTGACQTRDIMWLMIKKLCRGRSIVRGECEYRIYSCGLCQQIYCSIVHPSGIK
ncbi:SDR family oxidoreductase [Paenibacillus rhizoplanae]